MPVEEVRSTEQAQVLPFCEHPEDKRVIKPLRVKFYPQHQPLAANDRDYVGVFLPDCLQFRAEYPSTFTGAYRYALLLDHFQNPACYSARESVATERAGIVFVEIVDVPFALDEQRGDFGNSPSKRLTKQVVVATDTF